MPSRRKFLTAIPALGAVAAQRTSFPQAETRPASSVSPDNQNLALQDDWQFFLDSAGVAGPDRIPSSSPWEAVSVPHTWQALGGAPDYVGVAWYRTKIHAPAAWQHSFVRIEFEAVFHTAHIFLNGVPVGQHIGKGYTAFQCDLSPALKPAQANFLHVRVDNSFSDTMLPRMKSFDWANDGGIVRPVSLLITPGVFIERVEIDAAPDTGNQSASVSMRTVIRNTLPVVQTARLRGVVFLLDAASGQHAIPDKSVHIAPNSTLTVSHDPIAIASPALWHFDSTNLYQAEITLDSDAGVHQLCDTFGIRSFEVRGTSFYLNGERVSIMGVERMAGSHPQFGMAEPTHWIESNHRDMKELNCVYTRVHWPQDKRVLDFCDRNGILMQEEVPAWGPDTFDKTSDELQKQLETNGLEQLQEMIARDRNHPCIVTWGLCNEVNGKNPRTRAFATALAKAARATDPSRLLTYASNSLGEHPEQDMAGDFDFISTNEYFGSWAPGGPKEVREHLEDIRRSFRNKPIVISEYGWCECQPSMPPGDTHRVEIVNNHTDVFREFPQVAGAIYFDYNDYRTLVGDKGHGALMQRVHGVVDLYANRKPSFQALRLQASPIERLSLKASANEFELEIVTRKTLPAYTLRGYVARWLFYGYDGLPMEGQLNKFNDLSPGSSLTVKSRAVVDRPNLVVVDVMNPMGYSVASVQLKVSDSIA
jgi:beta-glucuronidase